MIKKLNYLLLFVGLFLIGSIGVSAAAYAPAPDEFTYEYLNGGAFCYNSKTGVYKYRDCCVTCPSGYLPERSKYANFGGQNNAIYCAEWDRGPDNDYRRYYKENIESWSVTSYRAVICGAISYHLNPDNVIEPTIYSKVGAAINSYISGCDNPLGGSHSFSNLNSELQAAIDYAKNYYNSNKTNMETTTLATPKISGTGKNFTVASSNTYQSSTITISNLTPTQAGEKTKFNVKVTTDNANATVKIPTVSNSYAASLDFTYDTNNSTKPSYVDSNGNIKFILYVRGTDIAGTKVKITVTASNSSTYYTSYLYYSKHYGKDKQRFVYPGTGVVNRSASKTATMTIPATNSYNIYINKIDKETGETINGASFSLKYNGTDVNLTDKGNGTFAWQSGDTLTEYDFSKFTLAEVRAPGGYLLSNGAVTFPAVETGSACYKVVNDDYVLEEDNEYCGTHGFTCSGDATLSGDKCNTISEVAATPTCTGEGYEGYTYDSDSGMCTRDAEPANPDNPDEPPVTYDPKVPVYSCSAGEQVGNMCQITTQTNAVCKNGDTTLDSKYCSTTDTYVNFTFDGKTLNIDVPNEKNRVTISKSTITGDKEIPGARLKICTEAAYNSTENHIECAPYREDLEWTSGTSPREFRGLEPGNYVIIETIAPSGYGKLSTTVNFTIDAEGKVTGSTVAKIDGTDIVVVNNDLNRISISKTDMATTKELPGAKLAICQAVTKVDVDENDTTEDDTEEQDDQDTYTSDKFIVNRYTGECIPAVLNDGSRAEWISTDKPHEVVGLPAGKYYLVERISPANYDNAESILFILNEDGTLTDGDGKSLAGNKLVMADAPLNDVKTGMLPIFIICGFAFVSFGALAYVYFFKNKKTPNVENK